MKIALVGCGYWGSHYVRLLGPDLACVVDPDPARLAEAKLRAERLELSPKLCRSLNEMGEVEAAVIATPTITHEAVALYFLDKGIPVLVEKPLAASLEQAANICEASVRKNVSVLVNHIYLFHPALRVLRQRLPPRLDYLYFRRTNFGPVREDVDALWDLAPHDIAVANWLLDEELTAVQAYGTREYVFARISYSDVEAGLHCSWLTSPKARRMEVSGGNTRLIFDDLKPGRIEVYTDASIATIQPAPVEEPLANTVEEFKKVVEGAHPPKGADAVAGYHVVRILTFMSESMKANGRLIKL